MLVNQSKISLSCSPSVTVSEFVLSVLVSVEIVCNDLLGSELGCSVTTLAFLANAVMSAHVAANTAAPSAKTVLSVHAFPAAFVASHTTAGGADSNI